MNRDPFQAYCESVCAKVRWKPYHAALSAELTAHMEDHADALTAGGIEESLPGRGGGYGRPGGAWQGA